MINPESESVFMCDGHVITCTLEDIESPFTHVQWKASADTGDDYTVNNGIFNPENKTQNSTLALSSTQLKNLKELGSTHTFTCMVTVNITDLPLTATQILTIFNPGKAPALTDIYT